MTHNAKDNLKDGDLERLLLHATQAELAGVFRKTPVDPASIMAQTRGRRGWLRGARIAMPIAACVALWFGLAETGSLAPDVAVPVSAVISNTGSGVVEGGSDCVSLAMLNSCLTGPGVTTLSRDCACADLDRDGDVDFADFGRFQQTVNPLRG